VPRQNLLAVAKEIGSTRSLMDKLGVKPGARVAVLGLKDEAFLRQLSESGADVTVGRRRKSADLIFYLAEKPGDLAKLSALEGDMMRNGAIWVVSPKRKPEIADVVVIAAGIAAGLVDNKVVRFSDTHTALRFVVPLARR
jgi:hypothetical protein